MSMNDINSLAHTKWNCKYHIVFAPKYRRKVFYGAHKAEIGKILRKLCEWKGVNIVENEARIAEYIRTQLEADILGEQLTMSGTGPFKSSKNK